MIHLALVVLAFLFLCCVGLIGLGIVAAIFGSIEKSFAALRPLPPSKTPSSKTLFALGHEPIEPNHNPRTCSLCLRGGYQWLADRKRHTRIESPDRAAGHDARTCPLCLGAGHPTDDSDLHARAPRGMSTNELNRWAEREREREGVSGQEIAKPPHQQTRYPHITPTPDELERAHAALHKREAERREHQEAVRRQESDNRERDEAREREAREFLSREAERVLKEREEQREAETKRPPWLQ